MKENGNRLLDKKKILLIILCGVCLLGVTACGAKKEKKSQQDTTSNKETNSGDKKLVCTGGIIIPDADDREGVKFGKIKKGEENEIVVKVTFSFDRNDNIKSIIVGSSKKLDDSLSDDEINKLMKESKENAKADDEEWDDWDIERDGDKIIIKEEIRSKDKIENFSGGNYDDYDTTKSFMEKDGATCE